MNEWIVIDYKCAECKIEHWNPNVFMFLPINSDSTRDAKNYFCWQCYPKKKKVIEARKIKE